MSGLYGPSPAADRIGLRVFSVRDRGALGDGLTDDTAAISATMDAANSAGGYVFFPPGTYVQNTTILKSYPIRGVAIPGTVTILTTLAAGTLWQSVGTAAAAILLTANAAVGALTLTLASTATLTAGDLVKVGDDTAVYATEATRTQGYLTTIFSVDSGTQITLRESVYKALTTAANAGVQKITSVTGVYVKGIAFSNSVATNTAGFLSTTLGRDVIYEDCSAKGFGTAAFGIDDCYGWSTRLVAEDGYDNAFTGLQQFGYGLAITKASCHGRAEMRAHRCRHGVAILGVDNTRGEPRSNVVLNPRVTGCTSAGLDIHAQGVDNTILNPHVTDCRTGAIQIRATGNKIVGGLLENCAAGIYLFDNAGQIDILDVTMRNLVTVAGNAGEGNAIVCQGNGITGLRVKGCTAENIGKNFLTSSVAISEFDFAHNTARNLATEGSAGNKNMFNLSVGVSQGEVHGNSYHEQGGGITFMNSGAAVTNCHLWDNMTNKTLLAGGGATSWRTGPNMAGSTGQMVEAINTVATGATPTFDTSLGNIASFTFPAGNVTASTFSNGSTGQTLTVILIQDSVGSRTFAWAANIKLAGGALTLSTGANKRDVLTFSFDGTNWYEQSRSLNL